MQINNKSYLDCGYKDNPKESTTKISRIFSISREYNQELLSNSSSQSDLIVNTDTDKINIPQKFEVTNNMFARKK